MRKILNCIVLFAFIFHQVASAAPLDWKPDFESASVLPYYSDDQERTWVLLSKKSYKDREYGEPSWGDFGGKVEEGESAVSAAVRELAEETEGQITTTEPELLGGSFHQIDMRNSPFGDDGLRRHTLFFKKMQEKVMPKVALELERGPTADGSHEVSMYQWILAKDLLNMQIPAIFGRILEPLKYSSDGTRNECFSVPFFVLLQQNSIRKILLQHKQSQDFSQISFTKLGFQDWRLVHSGLLGLGKNPEEERRQLEQILAFDPEESASSPLPAPTPRLRLFHKPTSDDAAIKFYPFNAGSPNFWRIDEGESKTEVGQLMQTYGHRSAMLKELKEKKPTAEAVQLHPFPWAGLKPMTDAQLESLGVPAEKLQDTKTLLEVYQAKVKQMRTYTRAVDSITCDSFVEAVQKVLREERAHPEMFIAYHGCAAEIHFLNTVYKVLREKLGLPEKTVDWRLFDSALGGYRGVRDAFVDSAQSAWQKQGFLNPFDIFVSANAALTGNPEHDGCRTLTYWKNSHSEVRFDLNHMLDDVLRGIGLGPAKIDTLKTQLYHAYKQSYYVESPEPTAEQAKDKRPVGVLRQVFLDPESVQDQLALSGWFFNQPITFDDRILPDGTKISIYDGLEEGDDAWMKNLPSALRYMVHIRAGHSAQLEKTIETYNKSNADGLRPFGLFDYEVRLFTGANPAMVKTHYYPPSPEDSGREETVKRLAYESIDNHLQGSELPIRSFYDFHKTYEFLRTIIKNQLGIRVPPAPVSLDQFKGAVAQGDLQTMEVYLDDPSVHKIRFEDVDIITGESRLFTLADYMTMVAMRHDMAADTIETAVNKYNILIENNVHPTETPFALQELLIRSGLNDLQKWIGWNGDLDTRIRFANDKKKRAVLKFDVPEETQFSGEILYLTVKAFIQMPKTQDVAEFIQDIASKTDYSTLLSAFWKNLAETQNVDTFFKSILLNNMTLARWKGILDGFASAGIDEDNLYANHHDAILGLFQDEKTKLFPSIDGPTKFSENAAKLILLKLVHFHGRNKILDQLKAFNGTFRFFLVNEDGDWSFHHRAKAIYEIFKDADLIDNTWRDFSEFLIIYGSGEEGIGDILSILEEGRYTNFTPTSFCYYLLRSDVPTTKRLEYFRNPLLSGIILEAFKHRDYIEESRLSPAEKKELHQELYSLAHQKGVLNEIKTIPAELRELFASRSDSK